MNAQCEVRQLRGSSQSPAFLNLGNPGATESWVSGVATWGSTYKIRPSLYVQKEHYSFAFIVFDDNKDRDQWEAMNPDWNRVFTPEDCEGVEP